MLLYSNENLINPQFSRTFLNDYVDIYITTFTIHDFFFGTYVKFQNCSFLISILFSLKHTPSFFGACTARWSRIPNQYGFGTGGDRKSGPSFCDVSSNFRKRQAAPLMVACLRFLNMCLCTCQFIRLGCGHPLHCQDSKCREAHFPRVDKSRCLVWRYMREQEADDSIGSG